MSASHPQAGQLPRGGSLLSNRLKEAGRALLAPLVRLAQRLGITPNRVTVIGFAVVVVAAGLIAMGQLLAGTNHPRGRLVLDAVDGALARATGAGTPSAASSTRPSTARRRRSCMRSDHLLPAGRPDRSGRSVWRWQPCAAHSWSVHTRQG